MIFSPHNMLTLTKLHAKFEVKAIKLHDFDLLYGGGYPPPYIAYTKWCHFDEF